jgi:hypothetical protein
MKVLDLDSWSRERRNGLWCFVWKDGIIGFGLPFTLYMAGVVWLFGRFQLFGARSLTWSFWEALAYGIAAWLILGVLSGVGTWYLSEWFFRRLSRNSTGKAGV